MTALATQTRLGRYEILRVLGQGAMGVVYEATDPVLNRPVAIKTILRGQMLDPTLAADSSARFIREAQAVARLNHQHVVTVFDFGEEGDVAYIVMEFIRGRELKSHFDVDDFFDLPQAIRIMTELLDALGYAHAQGVVHRDVKPANVMLDAGGRVKLTDFGVARLADSNHERTLAGTMVGTLSYMSPEQIQGMAVGSRADLFAAGIILYQFLTRSKPFPGPGQWTIQRQIVHEDPAPPSFGNSRIPPLFDGVVARALAKDPAQRYASAAEFAADLQRAFAGEPLGVDENATEVALPAAATAPPGLAAELPPMPGAGGEEGTVRLAPERETRRTARHTARWLSAAGLALAVGLGIAYVSRLERVAPGDSAAQPAAAAPAPAASAPLAQSAPAPRQGAVDGATEPAARQAAPAGLPGEAVVVLAGAPPVARPVAAPRSAVKPSASARCDGLLQRFQLGEDLSAEELAVFQKECTK